MDEDAGRSGDDAHAMEMMGMMTIEPLASNKGWNVTKRRGQMVYQSA